MYISLALYALCLAGYSWLLRSVIRAAPDQGAPSRFESVIALAAVAAHLGAVFLDMHSPQGMDFSLLRSLSLILAVTNLIVIVSAERRPTRPVLVILLPLSILLVVAGALWPYSNPIRISAGEAAHIMLSVLAFGLFTVVTAEALLLNLASKDLKHHRIRSHNSLPPLESLENLMFELIAVGIWLLAGAILTGLIFQQGFAEQQLYHKFFFSLLALIFFFWLWWGHRRYGWRGRRALRWTLAGYVCLLLAYAGNKVVIEWILATTPTGGPISV